MPNVNPNLYGSDWSTFHAASGGGLDPVGAPLEGPAAVVERCARRLSTRRGSIRGAPDYGYDLVSRVAARIGPVGRERMKVSIVTECEKEEEVLKSSVEKFTQTDSGYYLRIVLELAQGPFTLVANVDNVTLQLLNEDKGG